MRNIILSLLVTATGAAAATGAPAGLKGQLVDAKSSRPVANASVFLDDQGIMVSSDAEGYFQITSAAPGADMLQIVAYGYADIYMDVEIVPDLVKNLGQIEMSQSAYDGSAITSDTFIFDEDQINDDESARQSVGII